MLHSGSALTADPVHAAKSVTSLAAKQRDRLSCELAKAEGKLKSTSHGKAAAAPSKLRTKLAAKEDQVRNHAPMKQRCSRAHCNRCLRAAYTVEVPQDALMAPSS